MHLHGGRGGGADISYAYFSDRSNTRRDANVQSPTLLRFPLDPRLRSSDRYPRNLLTDIKKYL